MRTTIGTLWLVMTCAALSPAQADLFVDSWLLSAGVDAAGQNEFGYNATVQNPLAASLSRSVHNSMAQSAYQFNWNLATGHFRIDADVAGEGGEGGPLAASDNLVNFHITQDTLINIGSEWTYQFSGGIRTSTIRFWVGNAATGNSFWITGDTGDTVAGDPLTDTFHVGGSRLLTPGNYFFRSLMEIRAVGGSPNSVSTAHGFANITLTTVPEPAALGVLAFAAVVMLRKRLSA